MAEALLRGLVKVVPPAQLTVSDPSQERLDFLRESLQVITTEDNQQVCAQSDVVILAVKPQVMASVVTALRDRLTPDKLVISIAAGIRLEQLAAWLADGVPVVRVMPNTPALIGKGASALAGGTYATEAHMATAVAILEAVGTADVVGEAYLDAVTGLSGSGPAYVYLMIEAMIDAGVHEGLPRDLARRLVLQTFRGSTALLLERGHHPGVERDRVTSPGGTTIAGVKALEDGGVRAALFAAVQAATKRSRELAGK